MVIKTAQFLDIYHLKTCFNVKMCHLVILKNVNLFSRDGRPAPWKKGLPRPAPQKAGLAPRKLAKPVFIYALLQNFGNQSIHALFRPGLPCPADFYPCPAPPSTSLLFSCQL